MLRPKTFDEVVHHAPPNIAADLLKGALAGAAATWVMNQATTVMYERESEEARERENRARGGQSALANAADKVAGLAATELDETQKARAASAMHFAMGMAGGAIYAVARRRWPALARAGGLPFGIGFFLLVDEVMNTALGFTPGPRAFPWQAHARGAAGHVVFGVATHLAIEGLDRLTPRRAAALPPPAMSNQRSFRQSFSAGGGLAATEPT